MSLKNYRIALCIVSFLILFMPLFALTTWTVNQSGGATYTDLNACITAINAGADTAYTINFTDVAPVTYILVPGQQTVGTGKAIIFQHASPGIVTIDGRLNVAEGGGTFTANRIHFQVVATAYQWCMIHGYDGQFYTDCTFGPAPDNGVIIRSGGWAAGTADDNLFMTCAFTSVANSSIIASWGETQVNNCTWTTCGRTVVTEANNPGGYITVNGGSSTAATQQNFAGTGTLPMTLNNVTVTGGGRAICTDWYTGNANVTANGCTFTDQGDTPVVIITSSAANSSITLNKCTLNALESGGAGVVSLDNGGGNSGATWSITVNKCTLKKVAKTGNAVTAQRGGTVNVYNTVIDGFNRSLRIDATTAAATPVLNAINNVYKNSNQALVGTSPTALPATALVANSVVDASCGQGLMFQTIPTQICQNNMLNAAGDNNGTNPIIGGLPAFTDAACHIDATISDCVGTGNLTYLAQVPDDIDDQTRPNPGPAAGVDIGVDEVNDALPIFDWSIY